MKKIFLAIVIFITVNSFCFSQDEEVENKNLKPKSMIGGTTGLQFLHQENLNFPYNNPFAGIDLFYRHQLPILSDFYLTANVGYVGYSTTGWFFGCFNIKYNDIPATVGLCYYKKFIVNFYIGVEIGILLRDIARNTFLHSATLSSVTGFTFGTWIPISESVNLEINVKDRFYLYYDMNNFGVNAGISYLIPSKKRKEK